jgi:type IV pilus secretin PilQ/predicted competence protein
MKNRNAPWVVIAFALVFAAAGLQAQSALESIKKGNRGDKSWAVLAFDRKAVWIGISQDQEGKVSLYFLGNAGALEGSVVTIDPEYNRSILVKKMTEQPPIFRTDIVFEPELPLSILKRNGHVVVAFNDERLLDGSQVLYGEGSASPAKLVDASTTTHNGRVAAVLRFEGAFDWFGFVRSSGPSASLLIRNTQSMLMSDELSFSDGSIQSARLSAYDGEIPGLKIDVALAPASKFSIAIKQNSLVFDSPRRGAEGSGSMAQAEAQGMETSVGSASSIWPGVMSQNKPLATMENTLATEDTAEEEKTEPIPWDQRVTFEFDATPVKDALRLIAASNKLNMVIAEGVKGKTTMKLENVTLKQALDKIIFTNDCDYYVDGNILTVRPLALTTKAGRVTKVYRLMYADAVNVAKVVKRIATNDSLVDAFHPEFLDYLEAGKARTGYKLSTVQGIRRSSVLVVTDIPEKIREINQVVEELDRPPVQILIESKLVEIAPNYSDQLGIDWDKTFDVVYNNLPASRDKELSIQNNSGEATMFKMNRSIQTGRLSAVQYAAMLDFLKTKTDSKLMSNPRLLATDNEESCISVGQTVPVASIQRGMGGQGDMVSFDYKEISIRLNVTPHVGLNQQVTMYVNPIIEEISGWKVLFGNEAPVTDKRSVNSIVTVRNGETVVIGGLVKTQRTQTTKRVKFLGNLPLLGRFFQHDLMTDKQTDVMIFITPTIVPSSTS